MIRARRAVRVTALLLILFLDRQAAGAVPPPALIVETAYPGASAAGVEDTVAAPIEQRVNGVENLLDLRSRCRGDGSYTLEVTFAPGTDLSVAQRLVQDRVNLALPLLPEAAKRLGVAVKKKSPGLLVTVCLLSDGRHDTLYLSNYASIQIRDELTRLPGVADVVVLGRKDDALRVWLDPDRLAAAKLTLVDFLRALEGQNLKAAADAPVSAGRDFRFTITGGQLAEPRQLDGIVVKATDAGVIRLRDVARLELGTGHSGFATLDGKPVVVLALYPSGQSAPQDVSGAVRAKMAELRQRFPEGLDFSSAFDFTPGTERETAGALLVDFNLPAGASTERTAAVLERGETELRQLPGVQHVLALSEQPFDRDRDQACIVARLDPARSGPTDRQKLVRAVRTGLAGIEKGALIRVRDLADDFPRFGYSLDFAIFGPERSRVHEMTERFVARLSRDSRLIDVWAGPGPGSFPWVDVDRDKAATLGLALSDISTTFQAGLDSVTVASLNFFGRPWQVRVQTERRGRIDLESLRRLQVRNEKGQLIPLGAVAAIREVSALTLHERFDLYPAASITANLAPGLSLAEARSICERLAATELSAERPAEYRLVWRREMPAGRAPAQPEAVAAPAAPPQVAVARPIQRVVTEYLECTGRLEAVRSVELRPRVSGFLARVLFRAGTVKQGEALFEIDPRPYQTALERADAEIRLREAQLKLAAVTVDRDRALVARSASAKEDLERDLAAQAEAEMALNVAKTAREAARLNLEFTRITAPIDGQIGLPRVDAGNVVRADETQLAILVSADPIYAYFDLDERSLLRLRRQQLSGKVPADGAERLPVHMGLADEDAFAHQGRFDSTDARIDEATGTIRCRAVFPNPKGLLMPGMFARLRLPSSPPAPALLVPERAVATEGEQRYVFVVTEANAVERRTVEVGPIVDGLRAIRAGVAEGDWIVIDAPRGLTPGTKVDAQRTAVPIQK
jgi:RND family efflux transporter MFP subunit